MYKRLIALMCLGLTLSVVGCGKTETVESTESVENIGSTETVEGTETVESTESVESEEAEASEKTTVYSRAAEITDKIYENTKKNTMFSPTSLNLALGMVENASVGETEKQLNTFLCEEDFSNRVPVIMQMAENATIEGTEHDLKSMLKISNSIWLSDKYAINNEYSDSVKDLYKAEIESVSFTDENVNDTVDKINSWCNEKTLEMIPEIVSNEDISSDTSSVIVNTVYFESPWNVAWYNTEEIDTFTGLDGKEYTTEFISTGDADGYYTTDGFEAFSSRYKNGLEFIGILPDNDIQDFSLADIDLKNLLNNKQEQYTKVVATMPKLNFETSANNLVDIMKEQGVVSLFDPSKSEVTKLVEGGNLYVDNIIQKTKIELDEKGTKAAAATSAIMNLTSAILEEPKVVEVTLNRPFAFVIYDRDADEVLFLGKVVEFE